MLGIDGDYKITALCPRLKAENTHHTLTDIIDSHNLIVIEKWLNRVFMIKIVLYTQPKR